jgi:hypothetical protein
MLADSSDPVAARPTAYAIERAPTERPGRCRCGTHLLVGSPTYFYRSLPPPLAPLLRSERFCGVACVHAFLLEALEFSATPGLGGLVSDVDELDQALRQLLFDLGVWGRAR